MPRCRVEHQKEPVFHRLSERRGSMEPFEENGTAFMPSVPFSWNAGNSQADTPTYNGNFGASPMKRSNQNNLQFNNYFSFSANAVWGSRGSNPLQQQQWANQARMHHANSMNLSMSYGSSNWGCQLPQWRYPRPNSGPTFPPTPGKQNRRFSAGDCQRPTKRYKSDCSSEVPDQFLDEGNEPVSGFMTLTPKGCSPNSLVCRINEDLRTKFGYSGRPVTYSRFCQHHHMLKFPGQWVLNLVIRNLNPLKVGEKSVFISECPPLRGPGTKLQKSASTSIPASPQATLPSNTSSKASSQTGKPNEIVIDLEASSDTQPLHPCKSTSADPPSSKRKRKKVQSSEGRSSTNRPRGVFAGGVQPHSIVLLVDNDAPYVNADTLAAKNHKVVTGQNLGALDYMSLIESDDTVLKDGVLFVVVPWLGFALKYFELFPCFSATNACGENNMRFNTGNDTSSLLNIVKDFQHQLDPQDFSTLTTSESTNYSRSSQSSSEGSPLYVQRILTQRLLYSALLLRSLVRSSYDNCDVVFSGFPVHAMSPEGASRLFQNSPGNFASQVPAFCGHLLAALRVYNEFAANTWRLGYVSKVPSFNSPSEFARPESRRPSDTEIEILSEIQSINHEELSPPRKSRKICSHDADVTLVEEENLSPAVNEESVGDCAKTSVSDEPVVAASKSLEIPSENDIAVCDANGKLTNYTLESVGENTCETKSDSSSQLGRVQNESDAKNLHEDSSSQTATSQSDTPSKASSLVDENIADEDANVLCIDNTEVFDDDDEDQSFSKNDDNDDIEIIELPVSTSSSNVRTKRQCHPAKQTRSSSSNPKRSTASNVPVQLASRADSDSDYTDDDDDDDEEFGDTPDDDLQDPNCIALMRLCRHRWFGKRRKLVNIEQSFRARRTYMNRRTEDTSRWFMERLMQLLRLSSDFAKNRASMVPWEVPQAVPPAGDVVPGAVVASLSAGVYETVASMSNEYNCTVCKAAVGNHIAADYHAYSWQHCEAVAGSSLDASVVEKLLSRSPIEGALPLSPDYLERCVRSRTLQQEEGAFRRCSLCQEAVPRHALRHHVSSKKHLTQMQSSLGLSNGEFLLRHLHWRLYRDMLSKHPGMDVMIVTDEVNHSVVQSLARLHPRVTVLSYSDFLRDPAGCVAAVQEWKQRSTQTSAQSKPSAPSQRSLQSECSNRCERSSHASSLGCAKASSSVPSTSKAGTSEVILATVDDDDGDRAPEVLVESSSSTPLGETEEIVGCENEGCGQNRARTESTHRASLENNFDQTVDLRNNLGENASLGSKLSQNKPLGNNLDQNASLGNDLDQNTPLETLDQNASLINCSQNEPLRKNLDQNLGNLGEDASSENLGQNVSSRKDLEQTTSPKHSGQTTSETNASKETLLLDISGDVSQPSTVDDTPRIEPSSAATTNPTCEFLHPKMTAAIGTAQAPNGSKETRTAASENACSVLWLIVTGIDLLIPSDNSEEFADIDEIMSRVYTAHAYLRLHLPSDHVVLTTPTLPLTILEDTLPHSHTSPLMNGSNAIRASRDKMDKIVQLYKLLFSRSLAVHAANAAHENVYKIPKSAVSSEVVRILTSEQLKSSSGSECSIPERVACSIGLSSHYFASTPWHVAMESLVGHALYGLPCPHLSRRPCALRAAAAAGVNIRDMESRSRLCRAGVVGELKFDRSSSLAYKKITCHKRWLQFDASDLAFILQLTETVSESSPKTWCLTAPFPKIVMQLSPNPSCVVNRCKKGLRLWSFQSPEIDVSQVQLQLRSFLTELQCKLPDGNFANVFPAFPCNFVIIDNKTDEETHQTIHRLHRSMANTFFTREREVDVTAVFQSLADAWRRIFFTNKLGHSLASDCVGLASVSVYQLRESAAVVHRNSKRQVTEWLAAVNSYFEDYDPGIAVQLQQPAEAAVDHPIVVE